MNTASSFPTGWRIVFTGRLASMSRVAAIRVVTEQGGMVGDRVTRLTDALVIGSDGWPLRKTGSITRNLQRASELQESEWPVSIIGEAEFLRRLCGIPEARSIRRAHTLEELSRLLDVSGLRLRRWIQLGLIQSTDASAIAPSFDYQQVAAAKTLTCLISRGVPPSKLVRSLRELQRLLPGDRGLSGCIIALENKLMVRDGDNLFDARGQMYFSFQEKFGQSDAKTNSSLIDDEDPDALFDRAYQHEQDGRTEVAIEYYTNWLVRFGEDHEVLFNLANVYFNRGEIEQAKNLFRRSVTIYPTYARAWNNLGLCLHYSADGFAAIDALRRTAELEPDNIDTLFNLADMLDEAGNEPESRLLWLRIARHRSDTRSGSVELKRYAEERLKTLTDPLHQAGRT